MFRDGIVASAEVNYQIVNDLQNIGVVSPLPTGALGPENPAAVLNRSLLPGWAAYSETYAAAERRYMIANAPDCHPCSVGFWPCIGFFVESAAEILAGPNSGAPDNPIPVEPPYVWCDD
jgi:hypothetical protein